MNIPDKAVEAAAQVQYGHPWERAPQWAKNEALESAREMLEAAAPIIAAQALRDEAVRLRRVDGHDWYVHDRHTRDALTARADKVEQ